MSIVLRLTLIPLLIVALTHCGMSPAQKREPTKLANAAATEVLKVMRPGPGDNVVPKHTSFPSTRPLPGTVIRQMPARIRSLPQARPMSVADVVTALGLNAHRDHVSSNFRWNSYYIYLDADHVIYLICDPKSLRERVPSGGPVTTRWHTLVTEVQLRRSPNLALATRPLPVPLE